MADQNDSAQGLIPTQPRKGRQVLRLRAERTSTKQGDMTAPRIRHLVAAVLFCVGGIRQNVVLTDKMLKDIDESFSVVGFSINQSHAENTTFHDNFLDIHGDIDYRRMYANATWK